MGRFIRKRFRRELDAAAKAAGRRLRGLFRAADREGRELLRHSARHALSFLTAVPSRAHRRRKRLRLAFAAAGAAAAVGAIWFARAGRLRHTDVSKEAGNRP
jgi:hypothetical protein